MTKGQAQAKGEYKDLSAIYLLRGCIQEQQLNIDGKKTMTILNMLAQVPAFVCGRSLVSIVVEDQKNKHKH